MNILLNGIGGHMGREVVKLCEAGYRGAKLVMGVDPNAEDGDVRVYKSFSEVESCSEVDCIVDFSHHSCVGALLDFGIKNNIPVVVATTGHTPEEIALIYEAAERIPVFYSGNMSLGIALLVELAKTVASAMPEAEIEIVESHHSRKLDAPSGTALMLAKAVCEVRPEAYTNLGRSGQGKRAFEEIGIHSIRMGNIVGIHEVIVGTQSQTITLKHEAHDRALFAEGALAAAAYLISCRPGIYDMNGMISASPKKSTVLSAE